ncbi:MAG TPA: HNH endonuclease signature motif containing protein [Gemmatimonadaceae bacterium]|nr:HNH endonuclease signature motif containing protein [Gemmatimonadaceae bacterium]
MVKKQPSGRRRSPRRGRGRGPAQQDTSLPTTRAAYTETRRWLLARHGPVCAYCERRIDPDLITLDHVTPRRGKTAYDRRDNLLLCCPECNGKKKDQSFLAFLLGRRERAASVLRYGQHLSPLLLHHAKDIAGPDATARAERLADPDYPYKD